MVAGDEGVTADKAPRLSVLDDLFIADSILLECAGKANRCKAQVGQ